MKQRLPIALFFIAVCAINTGAWGQKVYRCGTAYSQTPCADAVAVDVTDSRSKTQKAQADALTQREAAAANAMEKTRLQDEAQAQADSQAVRRKNAKATEATKKKSTKKTKKKKEPDYFTARDTNGKPKKSTDKTAN